MSRESVKAFLSAALQDPALQHCLKPTNSPATTVALAKAQGYQFTEQEFLEEITALNAASSKGVGAIAWQLQGRVIQWMGKVSKKFDVPPPW
jgi:predicted ribosomally synthesized peptide with nif11-like leader